MQQGSFPQNRVITARGVLTAISVPLLKKTSTTQPVRRKPPTARIRMPVDDIRSYQAIHKCRPELPWRQHGFTGCGKTQRLAQLWKGTASACRKCRQSKCTARLKRRALPWLSHSNYFFRSLFSHAVKHFSDAGFSTSGPRFPCSLLGK